MSTECNGQRIVEIAQSWIGTPYRHQAGTKNVGCDCLGLVLGVWRELGGAIPTHHPDYSMDWAECAADDWLLAAADKHLVPLPLSEMGPGDVLVFKWSAFSVSKHVAILSNSNRMIHAFERHAVCETALVPQWRRRISGAYRFPELKEK